MRIGHPRLALITLVLMYSIQVSLYAFLTPAWETPDEPSHYLYTAYLGQHWRPPGPSPVKQTGPFYTGGFVTSMYEWFQPPLGYLWQALVWRLIHSHDPSLLPSEFPAINPLFPHDPFSYPHLFLPDRIAPLRPTRTDIGLILLRWASALLGIPTILAIYAAGRIVAPQQPGLAVTAAGLAAFIPQFTSISGSVRNDNAANLVAALLIVVLLRLLTQPANHIRRTGLILGFLLGLALLTKPTLLPLLPAVVPALLLSSHMVGQRARLAVWITLSFLSMVGCYVLIFPEARLAFLHSQEAHRINPDLLRLSYLQRIPQLFRDTFWARFGWANVGVPQAWIKTATTLSLLGMAVTLGYWAYSRHRRILASATHRQLVLLTLCLLLNVAGFIRYNLSLFQPQGRYLFPSLVPLSILALWGTWQILPSSARGLLAVSVVGAMLAFNSGALAYHLLPAYYQAPLPSAYQGESTDPMGEVTDSITVGQTFVARYPNLRRIDVALSVGEAPPSPLTLRLRNDPSADKDLAVSTVTLQPTGDITYQGFHFPPIADSAGRSFYFFLELPPSANDDITVWGTGNDSYDDGTAFENHRQRSGELYFVAFSSLGVAPSR